MAHVLADMVKQTSVSTGETTITLTGGALSPYRSFASVLTNGDTTEAMVVSRATGEWQAAVYSYSSGVLTFRRLLSSSTGTQITFAAGLKDVYIPPIAETTKRTAAITVYVSTTGDDTAFGTVDAPVSTPQRAIDICQTQVLMRPGPFTIQFSPGTYTVPARLTFTASLFTDSPITFKGSTDAGIPDVFIQGSADGTRTHNFIDPGGPGLVFVFDDIYFHSFVFVTAPNQGGRSVMRRCWAKNCFQVMSLGVGGIGAAFGGDWDGRDLDDVVVDGGSGFSTVILSPFNLRQTDFTTGLLIHHWKDSGALIDEGGTGHMDFLRIEDCPIGAELIRSTGGPGMGNMRVWRCTIGILNASMTQLLIADSMDFGQGTANACGTNVVTSAAPVYQQQSETNYSSRLIFMPFTLLSSGNLQNSVAERNVWNPLINIMQGRPRLGDTFDIEMAVHGILTTVGTLRLYFGATLVKAWTLPIGTTDAHIMIMMSAVNGTDWRGQIRQLAGPAATPAASLVQIVTVTNLTSLTADTEVSLTWQAGHLDDFFQMNVGRLYSSVAGLGFA